MEQLSRLEDGSSHGGSDDEVEQVADGSGMESSLALADHPPGANAVAAADVDDVQPEAEAQLLADEEAQQMQAAIEAEQRLPRVRICTSRAHGCTRDTMASCAAFACR